MTEATDAEDAGAAAAERFGPGDRVQASRTDPAHHTRRPRYVRGAVGTVLECQGRYPLPDLRARDLPAEPEPVYAVRFPGRELFGAGDHGAGDHGAGDHGAGDHTVTVDLWESYLRPAPPQEYQ